MAMGIHQLIILSFMNKFTKLEKVNSNVKKLRNLFDHV